MLQIRTCVSAKKNGSKQDVDRTFVLQTSIFLKNGIMFNKRILNNDPCTVAVASQTVFGRDMKCLLRSSSTVRTLVFPRTVETTGQCSFNQTRLLKNLKLNSGLKKLGSRSFSGSELKTLRLPFQMPEVRDGALYCSWGMTVHLPDGLETIESN